MARSTFRVLMVDDYEPWRSFASKTLQGRPELQIVSVASDGLEAVREAQELQPDLILLDIGLPEINGIEAARRILQYAPKTTILFVSEQRSTDIVEEALNTGARGYVLKSDAASELLPAIDTVLEGKRFVSASLAAEGPVLPDPQTGARFHRDKAVTFTRPENVGIVPHHEAGFYSGDGSLLDGFTRFIDAALMVGKAVIVVATASHRDSLLLKLQARGLDMSVAIEQGRYISLDASETLSTFIVNGSLDSARFLKVAGDLIVGAAKAVNGEPSRVAACGECAPLLWAQGDMEAAIRVEQLWNEIATTHKIDILCGYSLSSFQGGMGSYAFEKICSAHSAVHSR